MQTKIIIALSICLAASLIIGSLLLRSRSKTIHGQSQALKEKDAAIRSWTNKYGQTVSDKQAAELRLKEFKESYPELAKQLTKEFDIKLRHLRAYMQTTFETRGIGEAEIRFLHDTVDDGFQPFAIIAQDGYLDFQADVYDSLNAPYQYTYSDTVKQVFTMRGRWWQKKQLFSQALMSNPNSKVVNSTAIMVNEFKDKRWGIGPCVSYGFGTDGPQTTIGISVQYSLIKF